MKVLLYRVGRNLNRAYRTAEAFGITEILLLESPAAYLKGNLFQARGRVDLTPIEAWPAAEGLLALETRYCRPLWEVDWARVQIIAIGGETSGLPRKIEAEQKAVIPMQGKISGLTVEAALAIALYEWRRSGERI
ncbi:MAG: hypothetical protein D6706_18480 [Chloroflexi bacterium]|nr:MAG: hypothetical protein D6706_18480 [Chloroflexota bacterium]